MWIFIVVAIVVAVILCAVFVKSDLEKTEWAEEIGRDSIFGTRIDRNWIFPPEDPMHYETCDEHKHDEVTLMLHFKDGTQKRIRVKDKGEPYDEYHLYLPKIIGNLRDGEEYSSLNAVSDARDYLDSGAFSHKGLTEQLVSDGYPPEKAEYGADNCGADWKEQAARYAKKYFDPEENSKEELTEILSDEGFTEDELNYAISKTGL